MSPTALNQLSNTHPAEATPVKFKVPTALDLHLVFNQLLIQRSNLSAQYFNSSLEDFPSLPGEQSIYFSEPVNGLLVLRSSVSFLKLLESTSHKSLQDLAILFYHHLFLHTWRLDTRLLKPALFKRSIPQDWPDRKPDAACTLFVKDCALEIRFWTSVTEEDMANWGKLGR